VPQCPAASSRVRTDPPACAPPDRGEGGLCRAEGSWYDFSPFPGASQHGGTDKIFPTLADRAKVLLVNIAVFYAALVLASGYWLPTGGLEGVWFLSALALWFLSLLSAPWFIPPRDALANAIGASVILVTAELAGTTKFHSQLEPYAGSELHIALAWRFCR
jgi:hypothetical protein